MCVVSYAILLLKSTELQRKKLATVEKDWARKSPAILSFTRNKLLYFNFFFYTRGTARSYTQEVLWTWDGEQTKAINARAPVRPYKHQQIIITRQKTTPQHKISDRSVWERDGEPRIEVVYRSKPKRLCTLGKDTCIHYTYTHNTVDKL